MTADNFLYAQLQDFFISGAGSVVGDESITLRSMKTIDGDDVTMSMFGDIGFGTLEPGNGTLEEQICFTGIDQNVNGTATLTGVSNVLFVAPYTQTAGLAKTHAGATTFVISNTSGFYDKLAAKNDDETITGIYTFTNPNVPRMDEEPAYGAGSELYFATKEYADSLVFDGAPDASTTQKGIVQEATQAQVDARTAAGSTAARLFLNPSTQRSTLLSDYIADTGAADAYVIAPTIAIGAYATGQVFSFKAVNANTTTSTLAVSGLTAKTIKKLGGTNLASGDIAAGMIVVVEYDGTNFQMLQPVANAPASAASLAAILTEIQKFTSNGTWTKATGAKIVDVYVIGGGGGSGAKSTADSDARDGGGAGGGGAFAYKRFSASALGATEAVVVGQTAAGGAVTSADGDGNIGTAGNASSFGTTVLVNAPGGGAGAGGTAGGGAGGAGGQGNGETAPVGGAGGAGGNNTTGGVGITTASVVSARGGGGGGAADGSNRAGGLGGGFITNYVKSGGAGGSGAAGTNGAATDDDLLYGGVGGGGGGGTFAGVGFAGGNGGFPGGGAGGGGGSNTTSGAGGVGAAGSVIVITYF